MERGSTETILNMLKTWKEKKDEILMPLAAHLIEINQLSSAWLVSIVLSIHTHVSIHIYKLNRISFGHGCH